MSIPPADNLICPAGPMSEALDDGTVLWRAPVKLNLALRVLGRRADGFHELDSIVAKVTLYDDLLFSRREDGRIGLTCSADCGPAERNLVVRAAEGLRRRAGVEAGAHVTLIKRIPLGAGLGGGSSDAATTLRALNDLWGLRLPTADLVDLAGRIGSDVPLFLGPPAARIGGRGQRIQPIEVRPFSALLHTPDFSCDTAGVYTAYDALPHAPGAGPIDAAAFARSPSAWADHCVNDLRPAAERVCPALPEIADALAAAAGLAVHLTGSGSALFCLAETAAEARRAADGLPEALRTRTRIVSLNPW